LASPDLQKYKQSMGNILGAARASAGPLWKAQRRMNRYRLLDEHDAAGDHQDDEASKGREQELAHIQGTAGTATVRDKKARAKQAARAGGRGSKAAARARLVEPEADSSSSEDEGEAEGEAATAADAAAAMQKLVLATTGKVGVRRSSDSPIL
jgi:hypothetical protein